MKNPELEGITVNTDLTAPYTRNDLMKMDPVCLRALFRERIHHSIEVNLYPILLGRKKMPKNFGLQGELILDVWRDRKFPEDEGDLQWGKKYIGIAAKMRAGEPVELVELDSTLPEPFTKEEMAVVHKLIWKRCSVRDWVVDKPVPDSLIEQILEAGRAAPTGCNLDIARFIVVKDQKDAKFVWSDIPTPMNQCVLIVICYDDRVYKTVGQDKIVSHNQLLDCAAAGDHMCLMAHALGLGAVWLTCTDKTAKNFQKKYDLPEYIIPTMHIAVGWTAIGSIKSKRMPLKEMIIGK